MNITNRAPRVPRARESRVLAERNQAAVAVGAWVESGEELREHPATVALVTEQLQQQWRQRREQQLRLFQENVRLRVAEQERRRRMVGSQVSASRGDRGSPGNDGAPDTAQAGAWVRQRLACPGASAITPHEAADHTVHQDEALLRRTLTPHKDVEEQQPQSMRQEVYRELWPIDHSEEQRRQRQSQILTQRRLFLSRDRQNVKENLEHKKHKLKTASLKQEKERARLQEEVRLGEARLLSRAQQVLEEREERVQQMLRQEAAAGERERRERHQPKTNRQISALRAQLRALFSGADSDLPPLCCCGSFWETHPDTCANNCTFHDNPTAYVQALQTVLHSWDLL